MKRHHHTNCYLDNFCYFLIKLYKGSALLINKDTRIAIIGSGISGMLAAYLLHDKCKIRLFEREKRIGGHSRSIEVENGSIALKIDTGFIVFNESNYPILTKLFKKLNISTIPSPMAFSTSINGGEIEWSTKNLNTIFGQRANLLNIKMWKGLKDIIAFQRNAVEIIKKNPNFILGELVDYMKLGSWFLECYLLPMGAAIWSAPANKILEFPAQSFIKFLDNHGLLSVTRQPKWFTVNGSSIQYVNKLCESFSEDITLSANIIGVNRVDGKIIVRLKDEAPQIFDHIIFACNAQEILKMLSDVSLDEGNALSKFNYQPNLAFLHTDINQMPKIKRCWSSWNYIADKSKYDNSISVTYWMNLLQNLKSNTQYFVTLNPLKPILESHIIDKHVFSHPVYTYDTLLGQKLITLLQGKNNTWFCGAYLGNGFHEDGARSAVNVVSLMGIGVPWL
jgi:uncharacterized protein